MRPLEHLDLVCRRHSLKLALVLLAGPGQRALDQPVHPHCELALRVLAPDQEHAVGAVQTADGESLDELAARCLRVLDRRGVR